MRFVQLINLISFLERHMSTELSMYISMSAWREILARTLHAFTGQDNVSPKWLINPATRRKLKLDRYYPDAGIAIRFVGLTAKGQKRQSDWELLETEQRDQTRAELCRVNGVQLVIIDPADDPLKQIDSFIRGMSRASRTLADSSRSDNEKKVLMPALAKARDQLSDLRGQIAKSPEQMMANLAESWRDREAGVATELQQTATMAPPSKRKRQDKVFQAEQRVRHERFGEGIITKVTGNGDESTLSILFDATQERTFLTNLVQDKLEVVT